MSGLAGKDLWTAVDRYIADALMPADPALDQALKSNAAAGLPSIDVAPPQGKFLHLLAKAAGAKRILEIGTLGGYSTIWLARALSADGRLVTLELDPKHAAVAKANVERAGLGAVVDLRLGPALESLAKLHRDGEQAFDFIFIDADKPTYAAYLDWSLRLSRAGTVIVCDNAVRDGRIVDSADGDERVQGIRRLYERMAAEPRLDATALQTVGSKGYDGFALAIVR